MRGSVEDSVENDYEEDEDEEEYFDEDFEEESSLNVSRAAATSPQTVGPSLLVPSSFTGLMISQRGRGARPSLRKHSTTSAHTAQKTAESDPVQLQPPQVTERDSVELNWSKNVAYAQGGRPGTGRRYPMESASLRETVDSLTLSSSLPARETFDTILSTSQVRAVQPHLAST
jgi:hypothetical protein